ncbi:MAG: DUF4179 domain-containing protein [Chloroflexi bacterium]|nr:DUF4179 domain-containing protein [Chloroflexota bacterium]
MNDDERIEAEALSRRLDGVLAGMDAPSGLDPELDAFSQLLVEAKQARRVEPATRARVWTNALRLAVEANAPRWRLCSDGLAPMRSVRLPASWLPRGWRIIPAIAALLLMAAVVYAAVSPVLQETWQRDPGLALVEEAGHVADVNQSITRDGITITVERAYVDGNQVVIGFTVQGPQSVVGDPASLDRRSRPWHRPMLFDAEGRNYHLNGSSGSRDATTDALVSRFDASNLPPNVHQVTFDLSFPYMESERPEDLRDPGTWHFRFTVPVVPGDVIDSPGAVTVRDITVTCATEDEACDRVRSELEGIDVTFTVRRVLSSLSELRIDLTQSPKDISSPEGARPGWTAVMQLEGAGCTAHQWPPPIPGAPPPSRFVGQPDGSVEQQVSYPPGEPGAECTFTVTELVADRQESQRVAREYQWNYRIPGPWVFHFRLP